MDDDEFEWDDDKATANLRKHKVGFAVASRVFRDQFLVIEPDDTEDYGEDRYRATGVSGGEMITVIYTERENRIRIISARRANNNERRAYR